MLDAFKQLVESGVMSEEVKSAVETAFTQKIQENRDQVTAELREEFAQRYEHDKTIMVEALDKMVTEGLTAEIEEFNAERRAMNEDRVKAQHKLRESATKFNDFMVTKLAEEIKEVVQAVKRTRAKRK